MDLPIRAQLPQYSTFDQKFQFKKGSSKKKKKIPVSVAPYESVDERSLS